MALRTVASILAALLAAPVLAATLTVEGVASPAWVERGGSIVPLEVGMALRDKDRIRTGPGSRALLRMAEGSAIKLGENAVLTVDDLSDQPDVDARQLVIAALDVLRGAFRFTADVFGKRPARRDVKIRIATITAGIRGTDVWGKSGPDRDVVCLIEGSISVEHGGREFTMSDPLSFFIAPRTEQPKPVAPVSKEQLRLWADETEIRAGSGAARRGGRYRVHVSTAPDQRTALSDFDRLRAAGFPAAIEPVAQEGTHVFHIRILNLPGLQDARAVVERLKALGISGAQVAK